jgi:PAS domain S-box-containing protein
MNDHETRRSTAHLEELALLMDAVEDYAIFLLSAEGVIRTWNAGAKRIFGYDENEVVGRPFTLFYPENELPGKPIEDLSTAASDGRIEEQGWRIRRNGERFWANTVINTLRAEDGQIRGFAKVTRELTGQRNSAERLRQSAEIFQLLVSSVRDYAIFMLDVDGRVTTWNAGAQRLKGYTPDEIIGRHFSAFYMQKDLDSHKPERELELARKNGSVEDEGWRLRKDGSKFWANVVITAVYDARGELRGFAKVTRDITDRKNSEDMQRALLEQREARLLAEQERTRAEASYRVAQESNRAKDEFLMTLSHELRTPMTAILGWSRLLPSMASDDPMFLDAISSISTNARLQARLIDDILDVSRIVSGKLRLTPELVEVSPLVMSAVDSVGTTAEAKDISITTALAPGLGSVLIDGTRIQQVIWNLLSNAVKFTPRHGSVTVSARKTNSQLQISVSDSGEGLDPQFLPHVFEPFRQAENPATRTHGGLGLGLSIVRYIAEAHGGTITAQSEGKGKGATFTLSLPIRAIASAAVRPEGSARPPRPGADLLRGADIVLVDDDTDSRKVISAVLRGAGASLRAFDLAKDAIAAVADRPPELLITDIAMPEMDGYELTRRLRERPDGPQLKIAALSAFPASVDQRAEFDLYLSKPIDPFDLVDALAKLLAK